MRKKVKAPTECLCGLSPTRFCEYHQVTRGAAHDPAVQAQRAEMVNRLLLEGRHADAAAIAQTDSWLCQKCGQVRVGTPVWVEQDTDLGRQLKCHGNVCHQCLTPPAAPSAKRTLNVMWSKPRFCVVHVEDGAVVLDYLVQFHTNVMCQMTELHHMRTTTYTTWIGHTDECGCGGDGCEHIAIAKCLKQRGKWVL